VAPTASLGAVKNRKNISPLLGNEPRFLDRQDRNLVTSVTISTELTRLMDGLKSSTFYVSTDNFMLMF
jgi:CRISPR/Cas system type I-B associated protein Csh2 (Cas7 group RAMP superfamily)